MKYNIKAFSAPVTITGKVQDESGQPLSEVSITFKGTSIGTTSKQDGSFSLTVPNERGTLVISHIGFIDKEVAVNKSQVLNIILVPESKSLGDVVVIGYGTQKRENVIGSVAVLQGEKLANRPVTQLQNALTGQLAGVTITQRNGRPGTPSGAISVRGVGSFGADPGALILVDGIPVGGFNDIDPNDVESISVLKDASSAAIYGARAANGVVLVTTKKGQEGKTRITYNSYLGIQKPTSLPQFVNSWEYAIAFNEASGTVINTPDIIEKYRSGADPDNYPNTDFIGAIITNNPIQTGHNLTFSGGSKTNQFNISLGYLYQNGLVVNNNYSRYNVRVNLNTVLSPKFDLTTRLAIIKSNTNEPLAPTGTIPVTMLDIIDQAARYPNAFVGQLSNGEYGMGINGTGTPVSFLAANSFDKQKDLNMNGSLRLDYKLSKDLKLSFLTSYVQTVSGEQLFRSTQKVGTTLLSPNQITQRSGNSNYYTLQGFADYTKRLGKSQVNVLAGYSLEAATGDNFNAFRDNLPGNTLTVLNVGSPGNQQSGGTGYEWGIESEFGRANYSYAGKYLLEGAIRRDGSSRFPTTNKYAYFPSVAIGWRVGQENFIKDNYPWISELKIKASRGVLGNQNLTNGNAQNYYPYQNTLGIVNPAAGGAGTVYSFGGVIIPGVARTTIVDSTLHWESTRTSDIGIETGFFKNKLTFSATYFDRHSYDIIYSPSSSVSNILGFNLSQVNAGRLKNTGWEFTLGHNNTIGKFSYNVSANLSIIRNEVLDLGVGNIQQPNGLVGNGSNLFIGYPFQMYYGYMADGLFTDQADIDKWPNMLPINPGTATHPGPNPGDVRFKDISGPDGKPDGKVDATYDRSYLGSQIPKYTYGVNVGGNFKGFDINVLLQGVAGVKGNLANAFGYAFYNNGNVQRWQYEGRWTPDNPDRNAVYPRMEIITNSGTPNSALSSFWILNGAYLRIKSAQLGYSIPGALLNRAKIGSVRIYVSGENLHTFSHYRKGWDPEINTGVGFYPILANYTVGLNISF